LLQLVLCLATDEKKQKKKQMMLHNHARQEIVSRIILKNLVSVDIRGNGGAGKSTLLQVIIFITISISAEKVSGKSSSV
jgi:ABC-type phosphate/phosphonate transport system ATPase subunit